MNSEDDVSDEDPTDLFDTDNVVVCQYDKVRGFLLLEMLGHCGAPQPGARRPHNGRYLGV